MLSPVQAHFSRKKTCALAAAAVFFVIVAITDASTSVELSLTLFYLAMILVVTWNCGAAWGLLFAVLSAGAQIVFGVFIGNPYSRPVYFYVDSVTRAAAYLIVLILTAQLRKMYDRAKRAERLVLPTGENEQRQGVVSSTDLS